MRHETDQDRINEQRAAIEFARAFGLGQRKIGFRSSIDRAFSNQIEIVAFGEVKCHLTRGKNYRFRDPRFCDGSGYLMREKKWNAAQTLNMATNCPVHLIVEFIDALVYINLALAGGGQALRPEYGYELWDRDRDDDEDRAAVKLPWPPFRVIRRALATTSEPTPTTAAAT